MMILIVTTSLSRSAFPLVSLCESSLRVQFTLLGLTGGFSVNIYMNESQLAGI